jgi:hypothetical protein
VYGSRSELTVFFLQKGTVFRQAGIDRYYSSNISRFTSLFLPYEFYIINQVDKIKEQMNKPSIDQAGKKEGSL